MNTGTYTVKNFFTEQNLHQIIIPELQRDYVWAESNVKNLLESMEQTTKKPHKYSEKYLNSLPSDIKKIVDEDQNNKQKANIGFIYAYSDPEMPYRYVLIDGQQRITTIFLLLLCAAVKQGKQAEFERSYFYKDNLKFDYKVREDAHNFLHHFVDFILKESHIDAIKNENWYYNDYEKDVTIQSIITNYKVIKAFIAEKPIDFYFIENHIEFLYFDTKASQQGENLYIYMNSRGESVSEQENIKAQFLKGLSAHDKNEWGRKWEAWQNLFWKYRGINANVDEGFKAFLVYINNLVGRTGGEKQNIVTKYPYISLENVEQYIQALEVILKHNITEINSKFTGFPKNVNSLFWLYPLLMYADKYSDCSKIELKRVFEFFHNCTRFIPKNQLNSENNARVTKLMQEFLNDDYSDIVDLLHFEGEYSTILTKEEVAKLQIYKHFTDRREEIENAFWDLQKHRYVKGGIAFLWKYIDFDEDAISDFDIDKFIKYADNFKEIFEVEIDDLFRRALLTKGDDYKKDEGRSTYLDEYRHNCSTKYSFLKEKDYIKDMKDKAIFKDFIIAYTEIKERLGKEEKNNNRNAILQEMIRSFTDIRKWYYKLIKNSNHFAYCMQSTVCYNEDNIFLIKNRKVGGENSHETVRRY